MEIISIAFVANALKLVISMAFIANTLKKVALVMFLIVMSRIFK